MRCPALGPSLPGYGPTSMPRLLITRLDRYVFRQLLIALVAATSALVALIWLTQSLRFVELVVNRGLSLWVFLRLTGLLIPSFVAVILPITTFVVVQFVYTRLAGDRELTVMRAAGMSPLAVARPALALGTLVVAGCYALNVWLVPASYAAFHEYQFQIRNRLAAFLLQEGVFTPVTDDLTVYVRSRDREGGLRGILIEDGRQKTSRATILAERGHMMDGPNGPAVLLENGSREEVDRQTGRLNVLTFSRNSVDLTQAGKADDIRYRDVTEMSLTELEHPETSALLARDAGKFLVEAARRLSSPLTAMSFALVALLSVLSGTFRRHGNVLRPLTAVLSVVTLLAVQLVVANLAARSTVLMPLVYVVAAAPGLACAWQLFAPEAVQLRPLRWETRAA